MARIDESPIIKEHVVFIEDYVRRTFVEEEEDTDRASAELQIAIDYLTAVQSEIDA